jgi:putative transcriptional regulator
MRLEDQAAHPIDALMAQYASGQLSPALHGLVAAHLAIKPDNRNFVGALEELNAKELDVAAPGSIRNRDSRLAAIFDAPSGSIRARSPQDAIFPAPLADFIGYRLDSVPWRTVLPGIREFHVPHAEKAGGEASLLWIKPGRIMPSHTHDGAEVTLVLKGGFTDASGHYRRGDIAFADSDVDHRPRADEDEDCICFAVTDAPLRLTGPFGRIVQRLFGH